MPYLASAGVGTIGIVDANVVELSNLHRQIAHTMDDVDRSKTESIAAGVAANNPDVTVIRHERELDASNIREVLKDYDPVLDGSDKGERRCRSCQQAAGVGRHPAVFRPGRCRLD
ncbi:ThiF family adenylyltransferase [Microbacterium profundi]|nr:ThiF family adenylyltransferase [Microbacterium profundi]MCE7483362.1 ThiF family adenylyltransferase [Microbacterium profundi]